MEKKGYIELEEFREIMAKLTADREIFKSIVEAHEKQDFEKFQSILGKLGFPRPRCIIVCRLICWVVHYIRCERACTILCR